jgi:hypothetical protein
MKEVRCVFLFLGMVCLWTISPATGADQVPDRKPIAYPYRNPETGMCSLKINDFLLHQSGTNLTVELISLWQFDPVIKKWSRAKVKLPAPAVATPAARKVYSTKADPVLFDLTQTVGLFSVHWKEDSRPASMLLFSGPVLCNDIDPGEPPKGMIATCVPFKDHATAMFVPDPKIHCRD